MNIVLKIDGDFFKKLNENIMYETARRVIFQLHYYTSSTRKA